MAPAAVRLLPPFPELTSDAGLEQTQPIPASLRRGITHLPESLQIVFLQTQSGRGARHGPVTNFDSSGCVAREAGFLAFARSHVSSLHVA